MAFYLTQAQVNILQYLDPTWAENYHANLYDLIYEFTQSPDPFGTSADDNVIAWFGAAKDANRGVGGASEFIRSYTAYQLEMRNGAPITSINSLIQNASNAIAERVYQDILDSAVVKDGVTYYEVPTAYEIGAQDAAATVDELANYPGGVANWSGNPLFIGLGITDFWSGNILADDDDAYDLALSVGAMFHAFQATSGTGLLGLIGLFYSQGVIDATWSGLSTASTAVGATYSYLWRSYGDTNLGVGDLVAGGLLVGSASNETLTAANFTETSGWLHAGGGADIIYAVSDVSEQMDRAGVFDGGEGSDLMSFLYATTPDDSGVTVEIAERASGVPFSALVDMAYGGQAFLFNIESLNLSDADDRLVVNSLTTTLNEVDALGSQDLGDTLDASELGSAFDFDIGTGTFVASGSTLNLTSFENAIGSSGDDTIKGSDEGNKLNGRGGNDLIEGGAATNGEDHLRGGTGNDTLKAGADGGQLFGGSGDDELDARASTVQSILMGGSGNDILRGNGQNVLSGGSGNDEFHVKKGDTISDAEGGDTLWFDDGTGETKIFTAANAPANTPDFAWGDEIYAGTALMNGAYINNSGWNFGLFFELNQLPDDFDFKDHSISYRVYVVVESSGPLSDHLEQRSGGGTAWYFKETTADFIIEDFRLGDFGILPNGFGGGLTTFFRGHSTDPRTYVNGEQVVITQDVVQGGTPRTLTAEDLEWESLFERMTEETETKSPTNGTNGNDNISTSMPDQMVVAGLGDDIVTLFGGRNLVQAGEGNDSATGQAGDDALIGDAGNDVLVGGGGNDILIGSSMSTTPANGLSDTTMIDGDDTLAGGDGNDSLYGGQGADSLAGDAGDDRLEGGTEDDTLRGGDGIDKLFGDDGNDQLFGEAGNDSLRGGIGADLLDGGDGNDELYGDFGNDTLTGSIGNDTLYGIEGSDSLDGGAGDDLMKGGIQDDSLKGGIGNDTLEGGVGNDRFIYARGDGSDRVVDDGPNAYLDTDRLVFTDVASTEVTYMRFNNNLQIILPDGSVVTLVDQYGPTSNSGIEAIDFSNGVSVTPDNLTVPITLEGTSGNDNLTGYDSSGDIIRGLAGDDTLSGLNGMDSLYGGDGNDLIYAGLGTDVFDGGNGVDTLDTTYTSAATIADLATGTVNFAATLTETATNFENATTGAGNDRLIGNVADNRLIGNNGNDTLEGNGGNDWLSGGAGTDTLRGGDGNDTILADLGTDVFDGGAGRDLLDTTYTGVNVVFNMGAGTVNFAASLTETATGFEDAITGGGNDQIIGTAADNAMTSGAGNDILTGNGGNDLLSGGTGNDSLNGGAGNDTLTGGTGADRFIFDLSSGGADIIADFNQIDGGADESDLLVFQGLLVGTFSYLRSGAYTGGSDNSEARVSGNQVLVDTNGDGLSDFDITLTGLTNANQLGVDDFLFT